LSQGHFTPSTQRAVGWPLPGFGHGGWKGLTDKKGRIWDFMVEEDCRKDISRQARNARSGGRCRHFGHGGWKGLTDKKGRIWDFMVEEDCRKDISLSGRI
jgi:hypothetical protein